MVTMMTPVSPATATSLAAELERAIADLETFPGLGPAVCNASDISRLLTGLKTSSGVLKDVVGDMAITWYFEPDQLERAVLNQLKSAGSIAPEVEKRAKQAIGQRKRTVQETRAATSRSVSSGDKFRYIPQRRKLVMRLNASDPPSKWGYWDLGEEWAEVRRLRQCLNDMLKKLILDCLVTGRALGFTTGAAGAQLVTPELWASEGQKLLKADLRYVLVGTLPTELSLSRRGAVPSEEIERETLAKDALERVYKLELFAGRRLSKETMVLVFCEVFEITKTAARNRVWPNAEIHGWKMQGRPKRGGTITAQELRRALAEKQNP